MQLPAQDCNIQYVKLGPKYRLHALLLPVAAAAAHYRNNTRQYIVRIIVSCAVQCCARAYRYYCEWQQRDSLNKLAT